MKRLVFGALLFTSMAACKDLTQPVAPSLARPTTAVAAAEQQFTVRFLSTEFFAVVGGINEEGAVVGGFFPPPGAAVRAFLWRAGQGMRDLGTLTGPGPEGASAASDINDRGEVVGVSGIQLGSPVVRAFLWSEAEGMRGLGTLGGENSEASAINNRREVVGNSQNSNGRFRAFLWRPGRGMRSLGTLGGPNSSAFDINDATQIVGVSQITRDTEHAFLWTAGRGMEDLGTLGGANSVAFGISETGVVVGLSEVRPGSDVARAFLWTRQGGMRSLGTRGIYPFDGGAFGVNTHRRIVGGRLTAFGKGLPFLWTPEDGVQRLPTRGPIDFGFATDLNEFGQIVGGLSPEGSGLIFAALWTPTAGPLAAEDPDEREVSLAGSSPAKSRQAMADWCAVERNLRQWSRYAMIASRACLVR
jgi:probable HAF family extracellular repeat protein